MFEITDFHGRSASIRVVGVGDGGVNAVAHMANRGIEGVEFVCINTDAQVLKSSQVGTRLQIGCTTTGGRGAGADPDVGRRAAMEDRDRIMAVMEGTDMVFIIAAMGGGTGTGAAPVVAEIAKELGILSVGVVTKPLVMEGAKRTMVAAEGIAELGDYVDSLITIPSQALLTALGAEATQLEAVKTANEMLQDAVQAISELITRPGLINVDFADVRTVMAQMGRAMMGSGAACGEDRARVAVECALSSPLLGNTNLARARGILVSVTAGIGFSIGEFQEIGSIVKRFASDEATVVVGTAIDPGMNGPIRVTVVATGIDEEEILRE